MRPFNQTYLDDILKFVNKYYQDNREAPTIVQVSSGVGVPRSTTPRWSVQFNAALRKKRKSLSRNMSACPFLYSAKEIFIFSEPKVIQWSTPESRKMI